jgi:hypothetical protein
MDRDPDRTPARHLLCTASDACPGDFRMRFRGRSCVAVLSVLFLAAPADAHSTYVGASLVYDVGRFSKIDFDDDFPSAVPSVDGEAFGFNVKVGRALAERWGVEVEFARSGEIENRTRQFAIPLPRPLPNVPSILPPFPDFEFELETEQQHTSVAALVWWRQAIGDRVELAYLGGVAFNRVEIEQDFRVSDPRLVQWASVVAPEYTTIEHGVGPAIGLEADIKVGEHAAVTAGVRVHGANVSGRNGWRIRPLIGLRWRF